jgi:hypothetical protein
MKRLLIAVVSLFPLATFAEGGRNPFVHEKDQEVLEFLGMGTEKPKPKELDAVDLPSVERLRLLKMFAPEAKQRPSFFGELKQRKSLRDLLRGKRRIQLYAVDPDKPEAGRLSFERHQKMYGFWYRKETGILDGSP